MHPLSWVFKKMHPVIFACMGCIRISQPNSQFVNRRYVKKARPSWWHVLPVTSHHSPFTSH